LPRATEYHSNERHALRISRHFCTLSCTLPCNEPCFLATAACLLPLAAAACYMCCRRLLCENQARGRSGLETILGRVLSNQVLGRFGCSLEYEAVSCTRGKNRGPRSLGFGDHPGEGSDNWFNPSLHLPRRMRRRCWPPPTCRSHPSPTTNLQCACDRFCDPPWPCLHVNFPLVFER